MAIKRFQFALNNAQNLEVGLNEMLLELERYILQIQSEIDKLTNTTSLTNMEIDYKAEYSKAVHNLFGDKTNAMKLKLDLYKIVAEIFKANGSEKDALNELKKDKSLSLNMKDLQKLLSQEMVEDKEKTYNIKG
jgi:hypothetical protein